MSLSDRAMNRLLALGAGLPDPGQRYRIVRELGRGGMGVVYEAEDLHLHRRVALKVLEGSGQELRARFAREAMAAARLSHPHIAAVYDATPDAIAMQLVDGGPISSLPRGDARTVVACLRDAALAVHHAHQQGLVHRDLKPGNVLVAGAHAFVVDFGLAKDIDVGAASQTGTLLGTPAFMAPEQANGRGPVDARTDVYGLGATLHACLAGAPPFQEAELVDLLRAIVEKEPRPTGVDRDLDVVLQMAMAKEPERRYQTAADFADDLTRWLQGAGVRARAPSLRYRFGKFLSQRRAVVRATAVAAAIAAVLTGAFLLPELLTERATARAMALSWRCAGTLADADLAARRGRRAEANAILERGIAEVRAFLAANDVAHGELLLGRLLRVGGRLDEARAAFDRAVALDAGLAVARFERGLCAIDDDPQRAIEDLGVAVGDGDNLPRNDLRFGKAERRRLLGELECARRELTDIAQDDPQHWRARLALSKVAAALGDTDDAMRWSVSAVDILRGFGPAYDAVESGTVAPTVELELPGIDGILIDLDPLLQSLPSDAVAEGHLGLEALRRAAARLAAGDAGAAVAACEEARSHHHRALQARPDTPAIHNNRGVAALVLAAAQRKAGDDERANAALTMAASDFDLALHHDPRMHQAMRNQATLSLRWAAHFEKTACTADALAAADMAVAACAQVIAMRPELIAPLLQRAEANEVAARLRSASGDEAAARSARASIAGDCTAALAAQPRNARALLLRGAARADDGDREAARRDLQASLLAAPRDWQFAAELSAQLARCGADR